MAEQKGHRDSRLPVSTGDMCPTLGDTQTRPADGHDAPPNQRAPPPTQLEETRLSPQDMCPTLGDIAAARQQVQAAGEERLRSNALHGEQQQVAAALEDAMQQGRQVESRVLGGGGRKGGLEKGAAEETPSLLEQIEHAGDDAPADVAVLRSLPDAEGQPPASKGKLVIPSPTEDLSYSRCSTQHRRRPDAATGSSGPASPQDWMQQPEPHSQGYMQTALGTVSNAAGNTCVLVGKTAGWAAEGVQISGRFVADKVAQIYGGAGGEDELDIIVPDPDLSAGGLQGGGAGAPADLVATDGMPVADKTMGGGGGRPKGWGDGRPRGGACSRG